MRKARWWSLCAFGALTLLAVSASGEDNKDKDRGHAHASAASSAAAAPSSSASGDAGAGKHKETAEQKKRRVDYTLGTGNKIRALLAKDKKATTAEEKAIIKKHWRIAMRLLKIQRIAETAGKADKAKKAADLLVKEDARFFAKLEELEKAAPAASASAAAPKPSGAPAPSGGAK